MGKYLYVHDITHALKGRHAELFWPDDGMWYLIEIQVSCPVLLESQLGSWFQLRSWLALCGWGLLAKTKPVTPAAGRSCALACPSHCLRGNFACCPIVLRFT